MISDGVTTAKAFRQYFGFPIQYIAARTGIDVDRLRFIENGSNPSDDEIVAIARALELPIGLLSGEGQKGTVSRHGHPDSIPITSISRYYSASGMP